MHNETLRTLVAVSDNNTARELPPFVACTRDGNWSVVECSAKQSTEPPHSKTVFRRGRQVRRIEAKRFSSENKPEVCWNKNLQRVLMQHPFISPGTVALKSASYVRTFCTFISRVIIDAMTVTLTWRRVAPPNSKCPFIRATKIASNFKRSLSVICAMFGRISLQRLGCMISLDDQLVVNNNHGKNSYFALIPGDLNVKQPL